jgi:hypothetical protein
MRTRLFVSFVFVLLLPLLYWGCNDNPNGGGSRAIVVKQFGDLVGGPMALGRPGDYLLENGRVRVVVAKHGISRAFGIYGGNLIDADRVRGGYGLGSSAGGTGKDSLVEFFPMFFLAAVDTTSSKVIQTGAGGKDAIVRISGTGASFIALTEQLNDLITFMGGSNRLYFEMDYILQPGKNYVKLVTKVVNKSKSTYSFENFGGVIPSVAGMVGIFGKRNKVFIPGMAAYNIRFSLESVFKNKLNAPALPGLIGDFIASKGMNGVNYGIVTDALDSNFVYSNRKEYAKLKVPISKGSILVPLEGSSITACFGAKTPSKLKAGESTSFTFYMVIGDGSVSSIRDAQLEIHKKAKGLVSGYVYEERSEKPVSHAKVMAYTGKGILPGERVFYSDFITNKDGFFQGYLEPGEYFLVARRRNGLSSVTKIKVEKDKKVHVLMKVPLEAVLAFTVRDDKGMLIPAKVSVLGKVKDFQGGRCVGKQAMYCLFDPHLAQDDMPTDYRQAWTCSNGKACKSNFDCKGVGDAICQYRLAADTEYREGYAVTSTGSGQVHLRPGTYKIIVSRGPEYELGIKTDVVVKAGQVLPLEFTLRHSVPTPKMISADLHVHTNLSHDSKISDTDRITTFVAEGVDFFVATDHNRIRDMYPIVQSMRLERFLKTMIGIELTTFEMGHFNVFPLKLDLQEPSGGTPIWFKKDKLVNGKRVGLKPAEIFQRLRERGAIGPDQTIIQVNHPRDSIMGYFQTYNISGDMGIPQPITGLTKPTSKEFEPQNFSLAFDAMEIYNGKRMDQIWHWQLPDGFKAPLGYAGGPGTKIRIDEDGKAVIAAPGGGSDWVNQLNRGKITTGTANSDTHGHHDEAGTPRNYFLTGFDNPQLMTPKKLVEIVKNRKVLMTNGPILEMKACAADCSSDKNFVQVGDTLKNAKDKVTLRIKVRAASWVSVNRITVYKNGREIMRLTIPERNNSKEALLFQKDVQVDVSDGDAWFMVTARGNKDLWPMILPNEIPPFLISTAVSLVQDSLLQSLPGLSLTSSTNACLLPSQTRRITPYAMTNPIFVDTDGDGKYTPDPCRTLGEKGIRCNKAGSSCKVGYCIDSKRSCSKDADCNGLQKCIDGNCTVDPCEGLSCSKAFTKCDDKTPCANDLCPSGQKRCKDGSTCNTDGTCKDGSQCRFCACPKARKSCDDGTPCNTASDCPKSSHTCTSRRFCAPTACSLGNCVPTYPVCQEENTQQTEVQPMTAAVQKLMLQQKQQRSNVLKLRKPQTHAPFSIKRIKPLLLFFEHRH